MSSSHGFQIKKDADTFGRCFSCLHNGDWSLAISIHQFQFDITVKEKAWIQGNLQAELFNIR